MKNSYTLKNTITYVAWDTHIIHLKLYYAKFLRDNYLRFQMKLQQWILRMYVITLWFIYPFSKNLIRFCNILLSLYNGVCHVRIAHSYVGMNEGWISLSHSGKFTLRELVFYRIYYDIWHILKMSVNGHRSWYVCERSGHLLQSEHWFFLSWKTAIITYLDKNRFANIAQVTETYVSEVTC